jgi:hypothetical protein
LRTIRLPNDRQKIVIVGATGSGKTHAALWHLSRRDFDVKPWIIYDYKYDELIEQLEGVIELSPYSPIPDEPGLYIVHPDPELDNKAVAAQLRAIWRHEDVGIYMDEGYEIPEEGGGFRALLTQGRSKRIPMIVLVQRPVSIPRFVFTETSFFQMFRLQSERDVKVMHDYIPFDLRKRLRQYHSYYYDVVENHLDELPPMPDADSILKTFDARLSAVRKI